MASCEPQAIQFYLNDELISLGSIALTQSILSYLRYDVGLTGSKEGCAEGDCGACTVVIGEVINGQLQMRSINACIQFVSTLDGKALYTVEYLRQQNGQLHPVQQAMVDTHASQCGFCTPGFVMSLWNVYLDHQQNGTAANDYQLRTALSGNLCRCTGYRPILEAGSKMFELDGVDFDRKAMVDKLAQIKRNEPLSISNSSGAFDAPTTLAQLTQLRKKKPSATLLAGCTDIGLWVNKQFRDLGDIIYIGNVEELKHIVEEAHTLTIGSGVTLSDAFAAMAKHYPQINEQWQRFASVPIRNAGTLGGNIANGSPIGDSMPWLITLGTKITLTNTAGQRTLLLEDLYLDYMKKSMHEDEVVSAINVPLPSSDLTFRTYKLSKRYDSDISAVCAAFAIRQNKDVITHARIAFGGMAATPKRASQTEAALLGQTWNDQTVQQAMLKLREDYTPLADMRASADNRATSAANLLYRFYLETHQGSDARLSAFAS